ncbi:MULTISPECIES: hypothetical protein [unclassified Nocardioides]|uniref:hypothetical protein n=1 Tax=unclassified Nocardioides TaxID=2615069 RepID=UPI0006F5D2F6|nr:MULTISPECIES: hypothetical protein [unclassified Nocardioides]KRA38391.1 hypothetical protein ASD81_07080 [Nocardioides sp. Root614]KRA92350.1 hypothetical protein ASD84_07345 [Nocardioides sp. Root682]
MPHQHRIVVRLLTPGQVIKSARSASGRAVVRGITEPVPGVRRLLLHDPETGDRLGSLAYPVTGTVIAG